MNPEQKANQFFEEMIRDSVTPGLQYIILNTDSTIFEFNGGVSDLEKKVNMSASTTLNAFSVTKTFTALAILQLEGERKLSVDDPAREYLEFMPYKPDFSIHQLLNHTSGLPNPLPLKWIHTLQEHESFDYKKFVKSIVNKNDQLNSKPGEKYSYSNIGYLLLGEIIENVSGEDYRSYIMNNIIKKSLLIGDAYLGFVIPDTLNHAHGYIKKWSLLNFALNFLFDKSKYIEDTYNGWNQFKYFYMNGYPFGGLIGNARGFAKYLQALLRDNQLITNSGRSKLFGTQKIKNGQIIDRCLSWYKDKLGQYIYYSHSGGGGGYYCEIRIYPVVKIASVIMFNRTGVNEERVLDKVDKFFLHD